VRKEELMRLVLKALVTVGMLSASAAMAQTGTTGGPSGGMSGSQPATGGSTTTPSTPGMTGSSNNAVNPSNQTGPDAARTGSITSPTLEPGTNSFTESQARSRMETAGFQNIQNLRKDEQGIWRGQAQRNGQSVTVGLDYKGNVALQ